MRQPGSPNEPDPPAASRQPPAASRQPPAGSYTYTYTVGDERVTLKPTGYVAIDVDAARERFPEEPWQRTFADSEPLSGGLRLLRATEISPTMQDELEGAGALQPALEADDGTLMIPLPEVRVVPTDPATAEATDHEARRIAEDHNATVATNKRGQLPIAPSLNEVQKPSRFQPRSRTFPTASPNPGSPAEFLGLLDRSR